MMRKSKWRRLRYRQFAWLYFMIFMWGMLSFASVAVLFYTDYKNIKLSPSIMSGVAAVGVVGMLLSAGFCFKNRDVIKISKQMERFIRINNLYQSHYVIEQGIMGEHKVEGMDYYPIVEYRKRAYENAFYIRIRMDGCLRSEKFRDMEQPLADMFCTVCTERIEERGYLTYCFEITPQEQVKIQTYKDIMTVGENEIAFSSDVLWDWKKCPHLMVIGNTGSGKTQLAQYIISCFFYSINIWTLLM